jgi:hypothetical protein
MQGPDSVHDKEEIWFWLFDALPLALCSVIMVVLPRISLGWSDTLPTEDPLKLK